MRVIITGGTGLIGRALTASLAADDHEVYVLSRDPSRRVGLPATAKLVQWDGHSSASWQSVVDGADAVVNLAGESIADARWTDERKKRIYASRINTGKAVMDALAAATVKPRVLVQASAVGYYGPHGDEVLTEAGAPGKDFLAQVCFDWEASTVNAARMGIRRPVIRTGIVLSNEGGAWPKIVLPFRLFAGGPMGDGRQFWPWIHMDDQIRAIRFVMQHGDADGPFNLSAPEPLTNQDFAKTLGKVMSRPAFMPAPAIAIRLAFGEMATVLLDGQRALPSRLEELGFRFIYPTAETAFRALLQ